LYFIDPVLMCRHGCLRWTARSACRKTQGGCRFWDTEAAEWSDEGLVEITRTETYVVCETSHLSSFGISADDVLPEFNLVNPITDLDLFSTLDLQNALAVFVVAFLIAGFAALNFVGYRRDCRDRCVPRLATLSYELIWSMIIFYLHRNLSSINPKSNEWCRYSDVSDTTFS
jgi:hypothetical protein